MNQSRFQTEGKQNKKTIVIVSDVFIGEQVNGVGVWLVNTRKELEKQGFTVCVLDAGPFAYTFPLPGYPEIRLAITRRKKVEAILREMSPDFIHIATEGTLGILARAVCIKNSWAFTTSYHTRFPEYIYARTNMMFLQTLTYSLVRWFHAAGVSTVVTTETLQEELESKDFTHVRVVPLGVDTKLFKKNAHAVNSLGLQKPIFVYLGRIAVEKNVESFLKCKLPGSKLVIGDGPARKDLEKKYKDEVTFVGYKSGQELVDLLSISDVAVFSSKTDTFGLTIIEMLACGLPVAGYDVQGPKNVITNGKDGFLGDNLKENAIRCLSLKPEDCIATARRYSWEQATKQLANTLVRIE